MKFTSDMFLGFQMHRLSVDEELYKVHIILWNSLLFDSDFHFFSKQKLFLDKVILFLVFQTSPSSWVHQLWLITFPLLRHTYTHFLTRQIQIKYKEKHTHWGTKNKIMDRNTYTPFDMKYTNSIQMERQRQGRHTYTHSFCCSSKVSVNENTRDHVMYSPILTIPRHAFRGLVIVICLLGFLIFPSTLQRQHQFTTDCLQGQFILFRLRIILLQWINITYIS